MYFVVLSFLKISKESSRFHVKEKCKHRFSLLLLLFCSVFARIKVKGIESLLYLRVIKNCLKLKVKFNGSEDKIWKCCINEIYCGRKLNRNDVSLRLQFMRLLDFSWLVSLFSPLSIYFMPFSAKIF